MAELEWQLARFMAALIKLDGVAILLVHPVALRREDVGGAAVVAALQIVQTLTTAEVVLDRPPQPTVYLLGVGQEARKWEAIARITRGLAQEEGTAKKSGTQILPNALGASGEATWQGSALPLYQL